MSLTRRNRSSTSCLNLSYPASAWSITSLVIALVPLAPSVPAGLTQFPLMFFFGDPVHRGAPVEAVRYPVEVEGAPSQGVFELGEDHPVLVVETAGRRVAHDICGRQGERCDHCACLAQAT